MVSRVLGYAGKVLRVNLTEETISEESLDETILRMYLGGTGLVAKYLYDEVPPKVEWSDADNRIIFASGPLGGTKMGGTGAFSVVTKGPLTNGATSTQANGLFGAFLKFSGFDAIVLQGIASRWVYLYIDDGTAELRDAGYLKGKDTWETDSLIKGELGKRELEMSVLSIGPSGENLVKFACIVADKGHVAAHNGVGAVMGSKRLKAIAAARGKGSITLADRERFSIEAKELLQHTRNSKFGLENYNWGTLNGVVQLAPTGMLPVKNYTTSIFDIDPARLEKFRGQYIRSHFQSKPKPCWACQMHHCHTIEIPDGPYAGYVGEEPEYEQLAAWGPVIGQTEIDRVIMLANEVDRFGLDNNEAGWVISWVMECYEKGILNKKDTDGLEMTWGNTEAARAMLHKIALRDGFGDLLAEGVMRAAQRIGGRASDFAIHTMKGNTPRDHDHRAQWLELLDTCISSTGTIETTFMMNWVELGLTPTFDQFSPSEVPLRVARTKGSMQFQDSAVICVFCARSNLTCVCRAISAATGWDFTLEEAMTVGKRSINLLKAFNINNGLTAELDLPSPRYGSTPVDGPMKGRAIMPVFEQMKGDYYQLMGWDRQTGKPLPETLRKLGLDYVIPDIW